MEFEIVPEPNSTPIENTPVRPEGVPVESWEIMSETTKKLTVGNFGPKEDFFKNQKSSGIRADPSIGRGNTMEGGKPVLI